MALSPAAVIAAEEGTVSCELEGAWEILATEGPLLLEFDRRPASGRYIGHFFGRYGPDGLFVDALDVRDGNFRVLFRGPLDREGMLLVASDCSELTGEWHSIAQPEVAAPFHASRITSLPARTALVADAYRSNLCRDPDTEGRVYWTASGASREQVDAALQATDEWQRWQPLRDVYLDTVAKDPASTEFSGRMCTQVQRYLADDTPLERVQAELAGTRAGQRVRAIRNMYLELLERDPLPAERQTVGELAWNGLSLELIRARIIASPEYEERHPNG